VLQLQKVTGGRRPRNCRPTVGRIEVCSATYGYNGWLGLAQIWIDRSALARVAEEAHTMLFFATLVSLLVQRPKKTIWLATP